VRRKISVGTMRALPPIALRISHRPGWSLLTSSSKFPVRGRIGYTLRLLHVFREANYLTLCAVEVVRHHVPSLSSAPQISPGNMAWLARTCLPSRRCLLAGGQRGPARCAAAAGHVATAPATPRITPTHAAISLAATCEHGHARPILTCLGPAGQCFTAPEECVADDQSR
jgi:hypothetical protein